MATRLTSADTFRAVAARYQNRANETTTPALRNAYRQVAMGYVRLAEQQEAVERGHALIGKLHADGIAMDADPSGRPAKGRDDNARLDDKRVSRTKSRATSPRRQCSSTLRRWRPSAS